MNSFKTVIIFLILLETTSLYAIEAPKDMKQFNVICPAPKLIPVLDKAYHECSNGFVNGSCECFVETFRQLLPESDCQRSFDKNYIVPAIWLAGDGAVEDYVRLLYRMSSSKDNLFNQIYFKDATIEAKELFGSKEFQNILDGHLAEEYMPLSEKIAKELKRKGNVPNQRLHRTGGCAPGR